MVLVENLKEKNVWWNIYRKKNMIVDINVAYVIQAMYMASCATPVIRVWYFKCITRVKI